MTSFSPSQSVIFNKVRCALQKQEAIAGEITQRLNTVDKERVAARKRMRRIVKNQEEVVKEQDDAAKDTGKIAHNQVKTAKELLAMEADLEVMANDQEVIAKDLIAMAKDLRTIAKHQETIAKNQEMIAHDQAELTKKQRRIRRKQARIACDQAELAKEEGEVERGQNRIAELSATNARLQEEVIALLNRLDEYGAVKPLLLEFPDDETVLWGKNGRVTLTRIQHDIVRILYHTKRRTMSIGKLEDQVWGTETMPPTTNNVKVTLHTLNKALREAGCPYRVKRIKLSRKTTEVANPVTQQPQTVVVRREIEVYKLLYLDF